MRKLLSFVVALLVAVACIGFFREWFSLSTNRDALNKNVEVNLKVDTEKMKRDVSTVEEKTKSLLEADK